MGWPRGVSSYVVSHWPVAQGFVMAYLFINKRIDAIRIDLAPKVSLPSQSDKGEGSSTKKDWDVASKELKKHLKKYETPAIRAARKWNKVVKRANEGKVISKRHPSHPTNMSLGKASIERSASVSALNHFVEHM